MLDLFVATAVALSQSPASPAPVAPDVACQHEDGNTDGTACVWTDPDTGTEYWVDSSNYWVDGIAPAGAADLTWCPRDEVWSRVWDPCPVS